MKWFEFSENVLVLRKAELNINATQLRNLRIESVIDIIETDEEIAVHHELENVSVLIEGIGRSTESPTQSKNQSMVKIPVCYELGLDWDEVEHLTGLLKDEIIQIHLKQVYQVRYGFLPGFMYLNELDNRIKCKRRSTPRKTIPSGAIGIGGDKTGMYSLESPGGWQIIGRTPITLFKLEYNNPLTVETGTPLQFFRISKDEYETWS